MATSITHTCECPAGMATISVDHCGEKKPEIPTCDRCRKVSGRGPRLIFRIIDLDETYIGV